MDDHTRATWTYLLQYKSDALGALKIFHKMMVVQFDSCIKMIRLDITQEFESKPCKLFFAEHGLLHQTSCVGRHQKNGRVERKHRHLLEVSRTLRFQASLPLKYWVDCVLSTSHIINRLPTLMLVIKTPYELLLTIHLLMII